MLPFLHGVPQQSSNTTIHKGKRVNVCAGPLVSVCSHFARFESHCSLKPAPHRSLAAISCYLALLPHDCPALATWWILHLSHCPTAASIADHHVSTALSDSNSLRPLGDSALGVVILLCAPASWLTCLDILHKCLLPLWTLPCGWQTLLTINTPQPPTHHGLRWSCLCAAGRNDQAALLHKGAARSACNGLQSI